MKDMYYFKSSFVVATLLQHLEAQEQLLEAQKQLLETQRQIIELQKQNAALQRKIAKANPKVPKDKDVFWYMVSDGISSEDAASSNDIVTVEQFNDWLTKFGQKHVKPYVNSKVFGECMNQMKRGLARHLAELETLALFSKNNGKHPPGFLRDN